MFDHIEIKSAPDLVGQKIQQAIHLGIYGPGDRLPPEQQLAANLGVSRMTVRDALHVLHAKGYVHSKRGPKGGWFITESMAAQSALRASLRESLPYLNQILDFRMVVEVAAARFAAERRSLRHVEQMADALEALERATDFSDFRRADSEFHLAVAVAARNPMLEKAVAEARITLFVLTDAVGFGVILQSTLKEHREILGAIQRENSPEAAELMGKHIETTRQELYHILDNEGVAP